MIKRSNLIQGRRSSGMDLDSSAIGNTIETQQSKNRFGRQESLNLRRQKTLGSSRIVLKQNAIVKKLSGMNVNSPSSDVIEEFNEEQVHKETQIVNLDDENHLTPLKPTLNQRSVPISEKKTFENTNNSFDQY